MSVFHITTAFGRQIAGAMFFTSTSVELRIAGQEVNSVVSAIADNCSMNSSSAQYVLLGEVSKERLLDLAESARSQTSRRAAAHSLGFGVFLVTILTKNGVFDSVALSTDGLNEVRNSICGPFSTIEAMGNGLLSESQFWYQEILKESLVSMAEAARTDEEIQEEINRYAEKTGDLPHLSLHDPSEAYFLHDASQRYRYCEKSPD